MAAAVDKHDVKDAPPSASKEPPSGNLEVKDILERPYRFQTAQTGSASASSLTTRQLCRILCPAEGVVSHLITAETLVIGYDAVTGQYSPEGWKAAKRMPVLRESCAQWYYIIDGEKKTVQGPVSCRTLARALLSSKKHNASNDASTKVWSPQLVSPEDTGAEQQWKSLSDLPYLRAALAAFDTTPPPWKLAEERKNDGANKIGGQTQQEYDPSLMTFAAEDDSEANENDTQQKAAESELEAFLSSTVGPSHGSENDEDEGYESDGGTPYVKCRRTGNWIHAALAPKPPPAAAAPSSSKNNGKTAAPTKKRKKAGKFSTRHAKCWIYVTGLPTDTDEEEVAKYFSRAGIIDLDPETQHPKVKLYRHKDGDVAGTLKGDASICYARPESVDLALQLLDESLFRADLTSGGKAPVLKVQRAKFEQHGDTFERRTHVSNAKRKVARLAALQAVGWDSGENGRITGGLKGLRIIVLKGMFALAKLAPNEDAVLQKLEQEIHAECEQWGNVEKITIFSKNPAGVVVVKFAQPTAASTAIQEYHGRTRNGRKLEATFWDGVTDFTVRDEEHEKKETETRLDEFGKWLENQQLPEEFRLQVESEPS